MYLINYRTLTFKHLNIQKYLTTATCDNKSDKIYPWNNKFVLNGLEFYDEVTCTDSNFRRHVISGMHKCLYVSKNNLRQI